MLNIKYTSEIYSRKYGENAINECEKQIERCLTNKAEIHWKKVLVQLQS